MLMHCYFVQKTKKLLVLENEFHHAFSYEYCAGCAIHKSYLVVPVAIHKLQLAVRKKSFEKAAHKMLMASISYY